MTSTEPDTQPQAGPPVKIIVSGASNPNKIRQGSPLTKEPAAMLQDANGQSVPGATATWTLVSNVPASPGISVGPNPPGAMNGKVVVPNVQRSSRIVVRVSTREYPQFTADYIVDLEMLIPIDTSPE